MLPRIIFRTECLGGASLLRVSRAHSCIADSQGGRGVFWGGMESSKKKFLQDQRNTVHVLGISGGVSTSLGGGRDSPLQSHVGGGMGGVRGKCGQKKNQWLFHLKKGVKIS